MTLEDRIIRFEKSQFLFRINLVKIPKLKLNLFYIWFKFSFIFAKYGMNHRHFDCVEKGIFVD